MKSSTIVRVAAAITGVHAVILAATAVGWAGRGLVEGSLTHGAVVALVGIAGVFAAVLAWCAVSLLRGSPRGVGPALVWQLLAILTAVAWLRQEVTGWAIALIVGGVVGIIALLATRALLQQDRPARTAPR